MSVNKPPPHKGRSFSDWLTIIGVIISGVVGAIAFLISSQSISPKTPVMDERVYRLFEKLNHDLEKLRENVVGVEGQLKNISNVPEQSQVAAQLKGIDTAVKDLQARQSKLEEVIISNPAKAIEVPLIRKDLDNLKESQQQNLLAIKQGIDQVYDLNKWLLGAMAISIITLAVSNFLKGKEKGNPAQ
jgi:hypothetical protein